MPLEQPVSGMRMQHGYVNPRLLCMIVSLHVTVSSVNSTEWRLIENDLDVDTF